MKDKQPPKENSRRKKDVCSPYDTHLETRSKNGGRKLVGSMPVDADNHVERNIRQEQPPKERSERGAKIDYLVGKELEPQTLSDKMFTLGEDYHCIEVATKPDIKQTLKALLEEVKDDYDIGFIEELFKKHFG